MKKFIIKTDDKIGYIDAEDIEEAWFESWKYIEKSYYNLSLLNINLDEEINDNSNPISK